MEATEHPYTCDPATLRACEELLRNRGAESLLPRLNSALDNSADPEHALVSLTRFLEAETGAPHEILRTGDAPGYLEMLVELFSQGSLLSDTLCANPAWGAWLWQHVTPDRPPSRADLIDAVTQAFTEHPGFEGRLRWMRRFTRQHMLRIAMREAYLHAPFESVAADISHLADAMIAGALLASTRELSERYGTLVSDEDPAHEVTFCVLAMGKLGGCELNYSSDIDLTFLYSANGHTRDDSPRSATAEEYYRKLCELIIKALSGQTSEGHVFRVDTRLRPFGNSGPLACSLDGAVDYYSNFGRAWERQALIKARPCAGDLVLGETMLERLRPFVYPRYFDDATLEDIRNVKQQTETVIASKTQTDREVKLGRGGIRDIEFTVQMLQMLHGGRWPDSRTPNTLEALRALGERQRIRPLQAKTLERNYIFLRGIEHRLQIQGGRQTHILPESPEELELLARRLGYSSGGAFMNVYRERCQETRAILEQFLATKGDGNLWVNELLSPESDCAAGLEKLHSIGFTNAERAREEILVMANGPVDAPYTRETAQQFAAIAPFLLSALGQTPDPDTALVRLSQILSLLPVPATLYNLLKYQPRLSRYLIALISNSDYFSEMLVRDISLLDLIGTPGHIENPSDREELEQTLADLQHAVNSAPALYRLRDGEVLKIALRDLILGISVASVGDELSQLAEVVIANSLQRARIETARRFGETSASFAVLALGKFGGRELGYGSDLDLVFVYEDEDETNFTVTTSPIEYFSGIASQVLKQLKEPTRYGILYDVDARLRPDGSKGVLAIPAQRLRQYYQEEAYPWEKFALMKVRGVSGDEPFATRTASEARHMAFSMGLDRKALEDLEHMRAKLAASAQRLDLKRREGGIAEIEFATRILQLRHVKGHPELERGGVFGALDTLRKEALINEESYAALRDGYAFFRHLLNRARMMRGSSSACISDTPETLKRLTLGLDLEEDLPGLVDAQAKAIHRAYTHIYRSVYEEL